MAFAQLLTETSVIVLISDGLQRLPRFEGEGSATVGRRTQPSPSASAPVWL